MTTYNVPFHVPHIDFRQHGNWIMLLGLGLIVLGIIALGAAVAATYLSVMALGTIMVIAGVINCIRATATSRQTGFFVELLTGLLYLFVGLVVLSNPGIAALTLTLVMAVLFLVGGLFRIVTSLVYQFQNWEWLLISGVVSGILGLVIITGWPVDALWVVGLFVAVDLIVYGWWTLFLGSAGRNEPRQKDVV
jgi:uncharacterized membrane protein HdeD (DUF308 family)